MHNGTYKPYIKMLIYFSSYSECPFVVFRVKHTVPNQEESSLARWKRSSSLLTAHRCWSAHTGTSYSWILLSFFIRWHFLQLCKWAQSALTLFQLFGASLFILCNRLLKAEFVYITKFVIGQFSELWSAYFFSCIFMNIAHLCLESDSLYSLL